MQRLTTTQWFRRRRVGLGWRPVSRQGWAVTAGAVALVIAVLTLLHGSSARIPIVVLILAVYALVGLLTGGAEAGPREPPGAEIPPSVEAPAAPRPKVTERRERPVPTGPPALTVEHLTKHF